MASMELLVQVKWDNTGRADSNQSCKWANHYGRHASCHDPALDDIGDIVFARVGGDLATEIGQHFKASSPVADSILIGMTGASVGYIFADAHPETASSP